MQVITTVGLDIAKSVFQVHGVDTAGEVIIRRQLKRRHVLPFFQRLPACVVGIEACAMSHHWSRELRSLGHRVRLMPPAYVKPYVKRKSDVTNAEAICEAVTRTNMRFVETKTPAQHACLMLHRTRHLFIRQQTSVINSIRVQHRLRPILLTASAAILGMIPIMRDIFWGPMAFAVVGGLAGATLLTLLFLPALYVAWFRIREPRAEAPARGRDQPCNGETEPPATAPAG